MLGVSNLRESTHLPLVYIAPRHGVLLLHDAWRQKVLRWAGFGWQRREQRASRLALDTG